MFPCLGKERAREELGFFAFREMGIRRGAMVKGVRGGRAEGEEVGAELGRRGGTC